MRRKWWLKGICMIFCAMFLFSSLPVHAADEQIKVSEKEYAITLTDALNLCISNKTPVSGEIGSKVFLTYTVESVTKNTAIQSGVIGTMDNTAAFPYVDVGRMYLSEGSCLYDEGYTYVYRFERTEAGFEYQCAKLKGDEAERIIFASSTGLPLSGEENYKYYGNWIGGREGEVVSAVLNHVRCYDENGNDLGINLNTGGAINHNEMNSYLDVHPVIDSSYSFKLDSVDTLAISNKYPTDSDVVYMEYEVENIEEDNTYQQGVIATSAPHETYPHANNRGHLMVEIYEPGKGETPLLREGGKYFVCFRKVEGGFESVVQCTVDGKTETFSFTGNNGAYSDAYKYFSLWFGEGQGYSITADFKNVKCYDAEGNSLGIQLNKTTVPISHRGSLEDYSQSIATYYCAENNGMIELKDEQNFASEIQGVKEKGTYAIVDDTDLYLTTKEGKMHLIYQHLQLKDDDGNVYKRLKPSKVTFVTGEETFEITVDASNGYRVTEPDAPKKDGNTFKGWFYGDETAFNFDTVVTESITLYAKWQDGDGNEYLATMQETSGDPKKEMMTAIIVSSVLFLICIIICILILKKGSGGGKPGTGVGPTRKKKPINKRRVAFIICCCAVPVINWLIFYVFANLSSFAMAFTNKNGVFSTDNFVRFWGELTNPVSDIRIAFKNTFLTFAVILVSFPFKVLVSYFIYKKIPLAGLYRILFFLPSIIFSVALAMIFSRMIGVNGFIAEWVQDWLNLDRAPELLADSRYANTVVILHMLWLGFPGDLIIWGGTFARIPVDVLESAQIDGVNWWKEFTRITVPMVWPTVALQMVLMFCGVFGASGAVFLLTKGQYGTMTLSAWMYLQLLNQSGNQYTSNAYNYMSAVGLVITVVAIGISLGIRKWTDKAFEEVEF